MLACATVVSFPIARLERKTCLPRFCLHPLRISQAFCSPLVIGQETTAMQANQHKRLKLLDCLFLLFIIYCVPTALSASRVKKIDSFNKTGTTALTTCPHPNLKIIPSIFFVCLFKCLCFSFLKANALSILSVLTCQLLLSFQRC